MIRKAEARDCERIRTLMTDLERCEFDSEQFRKNLEKILSNPSYYYFLYEAEDGTIVGVISLLVKYPLHHQGPVGEIFELIVDENFRNRKIGERLLLHVENTARELGLVQLELNSKMIRKDAHRFYKNHGYEILRYNFTKDLV